MQPAPFWHPETVQVLIKIVYVAALSYGCISDIKSLRIPNAIFLIVLALFFLHWRVSAPGQGFASHVVVACSALLLGFAVYAAGFMGAGDIKLIGALMLWAGPRDGLAFLMVMAVAGGLFAGLLLITRASMAVWPEAHRYLPSRRLRTWAQRGVFPYGVAICAAGLVLMPAFFAPR